jgi:hypothetical protein
MHTQHAGANQSCECQITGTTDTHNSAVTLLACTWYACTAHRNDIDHATDKLQVCQAHTTMLVPKGCVLGTHALRARVRAVT